MDRSEREHTWAMHHNNPGKSSLQMTKDQMASSTLRKREGSVPILERASITLRVQSFAHRYQSGTIPRDLPGDTRDLTMGIGPRGYLEE